MTDNWKQQQIPVSVSRQILQDAQEAHRFIDHAMDEALLEMIHGPRLGPPTPEERERAEREKEHRERRAVLVGILEDVADEWGIDLHEDCNY